MNPEIEDALYSACNVTTKSRPQYAVVLPNHPRAIGTFSQAPSSVVEFTAKLRAFLGELDGTLTVSELLDEIS